MVKLIILDSDGVLVKDFDSKKYTAFIKDFLKKHGCIQHGSLTKTLRKQERIWKSVENKVLRGKISHRKANSIWLERLGLSKRLAREFVAGDFNFWKKSMRSRSRKEVKETLRKLKLMGYTLAVLSNDVRQGFLKRRMLSWVGIGKYFDMVYTSHSIGHAKPEKEAYLYIVRRFKTKPSETLFVGHEDYEIKGAKRAGLKTVYLGRKPNPSADFNISRFSGILRIL